MTCLNLGIIGSIVDRSTPSIVRESDAFLVVQMSYRGTSTPYGFENFTGATGFFSGESAVLEVPASLVSADLGKLRLELAASATSGLVLGDEQTFQVDFQDDRGLTKILFDGAISVVDPLYP